MPLWKRSSPEEIQRRQQEQQQAEVSRRALEAGGLPLKAQRRLSEEMEAGHPLFSSDLSANELLLTRERGYQPLSQVMGSSIYQVGWQYQRQYTWNTQAREMDTLSQAHQHAASLALNRLEQEAKLLGAHGVIGVRFTRRSYEWGSNLLEYTAIGTAIKLPGSAATGHPFLSDLSGQEFWTLLQAGYYPAGVVTGYCSYYVALGSNLTQQILGWWLGGTNQEIGPFTQGLYNARHLAMQRATAMARQQQALGIVGMHIENSRQIHEYETDNGGKRRYMDLYVHFAVLGTSIISVKKDHVIPAPKATLTFTDLRPGSYGQNQELTFRG
ncbi:MAG TPA: heavy metal-binding domain-containing protein [Ktedonobacteraceae bacterium]|nr:heavy metal-binding domain-containing protein [Ktedonobacteraceae bacterium]